CRPARSTLFPYTTLFRSGPEVASLVHGAPELGEGALDLLGAGLGGVAEDGGERLAGEEAFVLGEHGEDAADEEAGDLLLVVPARSEEHTSELQSRENLVC